MNPNEDLFDLVKRGQADAVRARLAANPSEAAQRHPSGVSLLMFACYHQQPALAQEIRCALGPLDVFEAAALIGAEDEGSALLDADPGAATAWSADGFTPLHLAAFFGNAAMAGRLLRADADPNALARNGSGLRPIHSAAAGRHLEIARLLLAAGADPNTSQTGGFTPLHAAAQHGDLPLAELLLEHSADRAARTDAGRTPSDLARERGHVQLAETLAPL